MWYVNPLQTHLKNELQRNGFSLEKDSPDEIILENTKLRQVKSFNPFNILITGNSTDLPNIKNHAIEDYLLLILKRQPELVKEILGEEKKLPEFDAKNGKQVLESIFGSFDDNIAEQIIIKCNPDNIPQDLKKMITSITTQ